MTDRLAPRTVPGTSEPPDGQHGPMPASAQPLEPTPQQEAQ